MPGNPAGAARSYVASLRISINFNGGAALQKLALPTHTNILSIQILILLPGENNHIPYMGGMVSKLVFLKFVSNSHGVRVD